MIGKKGSSLAGAVALKICPDILKILSKKLKKIVITCGTNGKTTTNNMIYSLLKDINPSKKVVSNLVGANMLFGVSCAFVSGASIFGEINADYACLEVDEFSLRLVTKHISPDLIVVTNIFRDQLDRYGEIDITLNALSEGIGEAPLLLNGDDPLACSLDNGGTKYFGIDFDENLEDNIILDGRFCKKCGAELKYNVRYYNQLGKWECEKCENARPEIHFEARGVELAPSVSFMVDNTQIKIPTVGFYNIYNALAAFSAVSLLGVSPNASVFESYAPQIGRMEKFEISGREVILNLSKNPAGFNQAIDTLIGDLRPKDIIIGINDNAQDGVDISWIWDMNIEKLKNQAENIFAIGTRREDLGIRLKYAEIKSKEFENMREAIDSALESKSDVLYILVNYTLLFSMQNLLKEKESHGK
jgi:UDP-N-acetylmuramyl tripeptide synthase